MSENFTVSLFQWIHDYSLITIEGMAITSNAHIGPTNLNVEKKPFRDFFNILQPHLDSLDCNNSVPSRKTIVVFKRMT